MNKSKDVLLAGLDIGTTGCKITVYSADGLCLSRIYRDYPLSRTASEHEVDPNKIWEAVKAVVSEAAYRHPNIGGIGVSSFGEAFVLLDKNEKPLYNAMLYTDPRGEKECRSLCAALGADAIAEITGLSPNPMYSISKLMWIKENLPDVFCEAEHVLLMCDFVIYMLTQKAVIDYSLASRTMAFDINKLSWSEEILSAAGISATLFSAPVCTGGTYEQVIPSLAAQLGLKPDVKIMPCGHDQVAAAIGSGVFSPDCAVDGAGTVECITPVFTKIKSKKAMSESSYSIVPYLKKGQFLTYAFSFTAGALIKWFTDNFAGFAYEEAKKSGTSVYSILEGTCALESPTGLLVLPHFAGAATPYMDSGSKGAVIGLTLATTQKELFLALMEGVCYEMLINIEQLKKCGIKVKKLHATGGGANSAVWLQMKADITGVPVTALCSSEAGGAGCAMMLGTALEVFESLESAAKIMVQEKAAYYPRTKQHEEYQKLFKRYKKLYKAVRPLI